MSTLVVLGGLSLFTGLLSVRRVSPLCMFSVVLAGLLGIDQQLNQGEWKQVCIIRSS